MRTGDYVRMIITYTRDEFVVEFYNLSQYLHVYAIKNNTVDQLRLIRRRKRRIEYNNERLRR